MWIAPGFPVEEMLFMGITSSFRIRLTKTPESRIFVVSPDSIETFATGGSASSVFARFNGRDTEISHEHSVFVGFQAT